MSSLNQKTNTFAYIDGANLHKGIQELGWHLDYARFRIWLKKLKTILAINEKAPNKDKTLPGSFS